MYWLLLSCFLFSSISQRTKGLRVLSDNEAGVLDPTTGVVSCKAPLTLPSNSAGCKWNRGTGTRGQTSSIFYMNRTYFFNAQEVCEGGKFGRTVLFQGIGPWCYSTDPPVFRIYPRAQLNFTTEDFMDSNIGWDHTCNVVVISPEKKTTEESMFLTDQVSEYDSQQRFQVPTSQQGPNCKDCWRRVPGLGALDFGDYRASWPSGFELNCGDTCLFYSVQEHVVNGKPTGERKIVGTSFRTGKVGMEIADSVQAKTLSWNPFAVFNQRNQFLGIGVCCSDSGCPPECKNSVGNLFLFSFNPKTKTSPASLSYLADIGEMDPTTIQVGIEYSPAPYARGTHEAYVFHGKSVVTFDLKVDDNGVVLAAEKNHVSPQLTWGPIIMWANGGFE